MLYIRNQHFSRRRGCKPGPMPGGGVSGKKEGFNMMNFIAIMCIFVGGMILILWALCGLIGRGKS